MDHRFFLDERAIGLLLGNEKDEMESFMEQISDDSYESSLSNSSPLFVSSPLSEEENPLKSELNEIFPFEWNSILEFPETKEELISEIKKPNLDNNPRKRNLHQTIKEETTNFEELPQEELLKLDSQKIESYMRNLSNFRTVEPSEEKELKRIRRLIKNREYAQSSRNKKKVHMDELEKQIKELQEKNNNLSQKCNSLEHENKTFKHQMSRIAAAMKSDYSFAEKIKQIFQSGESSESKTKKAKIATLFMIVFCFGIFSNFITHSAFQQASQPTPSSYNTGRVILESEDSHFVSYTHYYYHLMQHFLSSWFTGSPPINNSISPLYNDSHFSHIRS